ncbi:hypothetical protein BC629DRAFT_1502562 [Irpex lacteus]|nr:hypothetical protein BC629DRAFT_1502562 [Irpex lacteus]
MWRVGTQSLIAWNTSIVTGNLPAIELYSANVQASKRQVGPVATLATNVASASSNRYITVPNVANGTYRVIIRTSDPKVSYTSVGFSIVNGGFNSPAISLPNAYTIWHVNDTVQVEWDVRQVQTNGDILPSIDLYNSTSQLPVANLGRKFRASAGSLSVTVPNVSNGTYRAIIRSYNGGQTWASSPFTIVGSSGPNPNPSAAITAPASGTTWVVNSTVRVTFDPSQVKSDSGLLKSVDLFGPTDKLAIANLAKNIRSSLGEVTVVVPNVNNGSYRIIISAYNGQTWGSQQFQIVGSATPPTPPTPTTYPVTSPDASTTWVVGNSVNIDWDITRVENGTLKSIGLYSQNGGLPVKTFATGVQSTGSYGPVVVPYVPGGSYRIIIQGYSGRSYGSAPFTITGRGAAPPVSQSSTIFDSSSTRVSSTIFDSSPIFSHSSSRSSESRLLPFERDLRVHHASHESCFANSEWRHYLRHPSPNFSPS